MPENKDTAEKETQSERKQSKRRITEKHVDHQKGYRKNSGSCQQY